MDEEQVDGPDSVADQVVKLAEELEAHSDVLTGTDEIERLRSILRAWIDTATGFVVVPAFGRVTVLHGDARPSTIASAELPFAMSVQSNRRIDA